MSIIENRYSTLTKENSDYPNSTQDRNGFSSQYDNNNDTKYGIYDSDRRYTKDYNRNDATFLFWTLVIFVFILAIGNLILTFVILGVLRLGQGMESLELLSEENLIKFYGTTDLDFIQPRTGHIDGFSDVPLKISSEDSSVLMKMHGEVTTSVEVGVAGSTIQASAFDVNDPTNGQNIFSTNYPNFGLPHGVKTINIQKAKTGRIASPVDKPLQLESGTVMKFKGTEGTTLDGKEVVWSADQDIYLKSVNKSIILSGREGIYIDIERLPIVKSDSDVRPTKNQYKICVCMPSGKLFRVPVRTGDTATCYLVGIPPESHPCI